MLVNAFIDSHFNYAPLIWMFCRKTLHPKIEKIPYRTLKVCIDNSYNNILLRSNSVSIHQRHLRFFVTEIFKSISQINPEFMWSFFEQKKLSYQCCIQTFFGHTVFLKLRIGQFSDTQKLPMVIAGYPKIFDVQCIWGRIFASLEKIFVFKYSQTIFQLVFT